MKPQTEGLTMNQLAERNAEYVTTIAELEARCAALAAENAALKAICEDRRTFIMNGVQLGYIQVPTVETDPALETIRVAVSPQEPTTTPATDAFLAEVRAQGADAVAAYHAEREEAISEIAPFASRDHKNARIHAMDIAAQLRQEAK